MLGNWCINWNVLQWVSVYGSFTTIVVVTEGPLALAVVNPFKYLNNTINCPRNHISSCSLSDEIQVLKSLVVALVCDFRMESSLLIFAVYLLHFIDVFSKVWWPELYCIFQMWMYKTLLLWSMWSLYYLFIKHCLLLNCLSFGIERKVYGTLG